MVEQMWRVVAVFRVVTLAYAAFLIVRDHGHYLHPAAGLVALAVMSVWTVVTVIAYSRPGWRRTSLIGADVALAAGLVVTVMSGWVQAGLLRTITAMRANAAPGAAL